MCACSKLGAWHLSCLYLYLVQHPRVNPRVKSLTLTLRSAARLRCAASLDLVRVGQRDGVFLGFGPERGRAFSCEKKSRCRRRRSLLAVPLCSMASTPTTEEPSDLVSSLDALDKADPIFAGLTRHTYGGRLQWSKRHEQVHGRQGEGQGQEPRERWEAEARHRKEAEAAAETGRCDASMSDAAQWPSCSCSAPGRVALFLSDLYDCWLHRRGRHAPNLRCGTRL